MVGWKLLRALIGTSMVSLGNLSALNSSLDVEFGDLKLRSWLSDVENGALHVEISAGNDPFAALSAPHLADDVENGVAGWIGALYPRRSIRAPLFREVLRGIDRQVHTGRVPNGTPAVVNAAEVAGIAYLRLSLVA
jgi:hypothetical protein